MTRQKRPPLVRLKNAALVVVLLPLVVPLALVAIVFHLLYRIALYVLVWILWLPKGKDILFVYSDSPIWQDYMTTQVLPLLGARAVVLVRPEELAEVFARRCCISTLCGTARVSSSRRVIPADTFRKNIPFLVGI
jgi:hypothetical protein